MERLLPWRFVESVLLFLKLVFFDIMTQTACSGTRDAHHLGVCLALALFRPVHARRYRVGAHCRTSSARLRTERHHGQRIAGTLLRAPSRAKSAIAVLAKHVSTDATRSWTRGQHHTRIFVALSLVGPAGTVVVKIHARTTAHAARERTVQVHVLPVGFAVALS